MEQLFGHEKLKVYQKAIKFIVWATDILEEVNPKISVIDHLDRASNSIALNISEGNGRYTDKDKCRFFDISKGSTLECASCLDILLAKRKITADEAYEGKLILQEIFSMLIGLIKSNSNRVYEEKIEYKSKKF